MIREARVGDAGALITHLKQLTREPGVNIPLAPDEVTLTIGEERDLIADFADSPRAVMLVAVAEDGSLVGELSMKALSSRRALQHIALLGMSVRADWRGRGVGAALMTEALAWAPRAGITRIELYVYVRNTAAIRLYERFGFEREGRRRNYIREGDDYLDDFVMARLL